MESPYEVLGIDPDADEDEVVSAYRDRVKEVHPDQGGSRREFRRVQTAYAKIQAGYGEGEAADRKRRRERRERVDRRERGPGPDGDRRGTTGRSPPEGSEEQRRSRVEYLNYDVLADHGWELNEDDLFEKAGEADLDPEDHGKLLVQPDETLLEAAENRGFAWPFACRGGACTNCAVAVVDGEIPTPPGHILPPELIDQGIRLSCISAPTTDETKVVFNVKHLPGVDELRLPPSRFERAHADD